MQNSESTIRNITKHRRILRGPREVIKLVNGPEEWKHKRQKSRKKNCEIENWKCKHGNAKHSNPIEVLVKICVLFHRDRKQGQRDKKSSQQDSRSPSNRTTSSASGMRGVRWSLRIISRVLFWLVFGRVNIVISTYWCAINGHRRKHFSHRCQRTLNDQKTHVEQSISIRTRSNKSQPSFLLSMIPAVVL